MADNNDIAEMLKASVVKIPEGEAVISKAVLQWFLDQICYYIETDDSNLARKKETADMIIGALSMMAELIMEEW